MSKLKTIFTSKKQQKGKKGGTAAYPMPPQHDPAVTNQLTPGEIATAKKRGLEWGVERAARDNARFRETNAKVLGQQEATKEETEESAQKQEQSTKKLEGMLDNAKDVLLQCTTVFPFDLFPDRLTIDLNKVTLSKHEFFKSEIVTGILIKDIKEVNLSSAWFLATLTITAANEPEPISISYLQTNDALKARRILQGLMSALKEGIDLNKVKSDDLPEKLETLGKVEHPKSN